MIYSIKMLRKLLILPKYGLLIVILSCALTGCYTVNPEKKFDYEGFLGERIELEPVRASSIGCVDLEIDFPENYTFYDKAKPYIDIFTDEGHLDKFKIRNFSSHFGVNRDLKGKTLYIELALYYCQNTEQPLCLIQNVLYSIPIIGDSQKADLDLHYTVRP